MQTRVAEMLGVEFPICAFSHCRDVVAAVTNAGGFGVFGGTTHSPDRLESDLTWIDRRTGGKPFGVDLLLPPKFAGADQRRTDALVAPEVASAEHRAFVDNLLTRYGIAPSVDEPHQPYAGELHMFGGTLNFSPNGYEPLLDVVFAHNIRLIASALGSPPRDVVERAHSHGVLVAALVGTVAHARRQAAAGVDLIVAQGTEAGGHTGDVATMVLVPEVVDAVAPTPVLAAGGIARGRQIAAAFALGAEGVWCGSVWLTTEEGETPPVVKDKFLAASSSDTVRSRSMTGKPVRMLRTAWTDEWERPEAPAPLDMLQQRELISEPQLRIFEAAGRPGSRARELVTYPVGQVVGSLDRVRPTRAVVLDMVQEFIATAEQLKGLIER